MIFADTSVWIDHLRKGNADLQAYLRGNKVLIHPFILGEIACGSLKNRAAILGLMQALPKVLPAAQHEVLGLIERQRLWGRGLGWVDIHLLAAALLARSRLWTLDKRLESAASSLHIAL